MRIGDWSSDVCSSDLLGGRRRIQIGTTKLRRALEAAVLVEDDALRDQRGPGQEVSKMAGEVAIFGAVHNGERVSDAQIGGIAEVGEGDVGELRVALGRPSPLRGNASCGARVGRIVEITEVTSK